jgi:hypothetical protein
VKQGKGMTVAVVSLPRGTAQSITLRHDPGNPDVRTIVVEPALDTRDPGTTTKVDPRRLERLLPGGDNNRKIEDAILLAPTGEDGAGGKRMAGGTAAETKLTLDGASLNSPTINTVSSSVIQEFVEAIEIREAGYEAEFGGASSGQVAARRVSGSDKVRGQAGFRFSPRLTMPRFIEDTDEALRVIQTPDYNAQAFAVVSGPLIPRKLYFTVGAAPTGTQFSLRQKFFHRVDKDESGGFEECPFQNGTNDCAAGTNDIQTAEFASQRFRTGALNMGWIAGLDYNINPKHTLRFTLQGGPGFTRTTYRLPFSFDPNAFGTNPSADPLGGTSRVATGIVNDHFGWSLQNQVLATVGYQGRVAKDKIEIDANLAYFYAGSEDAWRLDNPNLKLEPVTQQQDTQGRNLYEFLDAENALASVPGVDQACNREDLPGLACPTRVWLSGGLGEYDRDRAHRLEGRFSLSHFFDTKKAGSHVFKYGGAAEWLRRESVFQYSGSNSDDFTSNCDAGETGGGEWCFDSNSGEYRVPEASRVDNHRFVRVDTDNPDTRFTTGFGRVRLEQDDLRAIADPLGRGVRVDKYEAGLSTFNYAAFLQDRWSILPNLSVSAGLRWEMQDMRDILGRSAILIKDNVAPRIGFVYDWTNEGRSRLFGSYGWFYQPLPLQLASRVFGGLVQVNRQFRWSDCDNEVTTVNGVANPRSVDGQPTQWCVDSGGNTTGLTAGAVVPRLKGQYNQQFQVGYEHEVIEDLVLGFRWLHNDLGRAVEDISTNGGSNFLIANPGFGVSDADQNAQAQMCADLEGQLESMSDEERGTADGAAVARDLVRCNFLATAYGQIDQQFTRPVRNFDAFTFELKRRLAKNWLLIGSYTYSRLIGNYDGFVDPTTGAINIGASTQYDTPALVRNSFGPLATNQPHRVKLDGYYSFVFKDAGMLTVGGSFRFGSGVPISTRGTFFRYGTPLVYVLPRGSGGRVPPNYQLNASVSWAYPLPKDVELEIGARLLNVTNAKAPLRVDETYTFQNSRAIAGGDLADLKHAKTQAPGGAARFFDRTILTAQGNYGVATQFQQPMAGQFELKLRF